MDWKYLLAIPSFLVGLLAGFQGIHQRYDEDPYNAALTLPGILYLLTRGIVPAAVYVTLYSSNLMPNPLWLWSLVCGTAGTELILRTKIFIKEDRSAEGAPHELMYGPFDLLRWYQNLFLESVMKHLPTYWGNWAVKVVGEILKDKKMTFNEMCEKIKSNLHFFERKPKLHQAINQEADKFLAQYDMVVKENQMTQERDEKLRHTLCYRILRQGIGESGLRLLLS